MEQYTDDDIRAMNKVSIMAAAKYLGITSQAVTLGMRNALLPIGFASKARKKRLFRARLDVCDYT